MLSTRDKLIEAQKARSAKQEAARQDRGGLIKIPENMTAFKPVFPKGKDIVTYYLNILPYVVTNKKHPDMAVGDQWYDARYKAHSLNRKMYLCPSTFGRSCPFCSRWEEIRWAKSNEPEHAEARALKVKERALYFVRDTRNKDAGIMLWDISVYLFSELLDTELAEARAEEELDKLGFADLKEGMTLKIRFEEKPMPGGSGTFASAEKIDFIPREAPLSDKILAKTFDLTTLIPQPLSNEELLTIYHEGGESTSTEKPARTLNKKASKSRDDDADEDDEDEDEEDTKPAKKASKKPIVDEDDEDEEDTKPAKKASKKPIVDEDDEDEDEEDDADEDDEKEVKHIKKAAKKPIVDEDDDEDNEDADEDDEDTKPAKKAPKKPIVDEDDEDEDEEPKPAKKVSKKPIVDEDDEDEEDTKPAKKASKKPIVDDEDEDTEDEDEAPKPVKKAAAPPAKTPKCFGKEAGELEACDDCTHFKKCAAALR